MIDQLDRMPRGRVCGGRAVVHGALAFAIAAALLARSVRCASPVSP